MSQLGLVWKFEEVEVSVGNHHVFRRPGDSAAYVHISVGSARPRGIAGQADAGAAFLAIAVSPAGNVEWHRHQAAFFDELHIAAGFDDFASDLVAVDRASRRGGAAAENVLVGGADVGGDDLEDVAMLDSLPIGAIHQLRKVDSLNLHLAWFDVR
jgi:hypothetical protein